MVNQDADGRTDGPTNRVAIIGIVRLVALVELFYMWDPTKDPYHDIKITLNVVEVNIAIMSASAPALRPLFRGWLPHLFGGSSGHNKYGGPTGYHGRGSSKGRLGGGMSGIRSGLRSGASNTLTAAGAGEEASKMAGQTAANGIGLINMDLLKGTKPRQMRSCSPTASEEEIMTYNGIMRTTELRVHFDGASTLTGGGNSDVEGDHDHDHDHDRDTDRVSIASSHDPSRPPQQPGRRVSKQDLNGL